MRPPGARGRRRRGSSGSRSRCRAARARRPPRRSRPGAGRGSSPERQRRRLDDDRRAAARRGTSDSSGSPASGNRSASRTAAPTSAIGALRRSGRRSTTASSPRHDRDARAGDERDPLHRASQPADAGRGAGTAGASGSVDSRRVAEDADRGGAPARRRPRARRRALPRRRQQPRLPRLLRAARGARDERGLATNALLGFTNMLFKLLSDYRPKGVAVAWDTRPVHRTRDLGDYKVTAGRCRTSARAVPVLPPDRRGVRLPQPRVRGLGGRRRHRDARDGGRRGRDQHLSRLDRPRRLPARHRERPR